MTRWEAMWRDLQDRVQRAQDAPVTEETRRLLQWWADQMDDVWNQHRLDGCRPCDDGPPGAAARNAGGDAP